MKLKHIILLTFLMSMAVPIAYTRMKAYPSTLFNSNKSVLGLEFYQTIINVSDYSGTSDTERIQKALNDVPPEGATVFIPQGIWTASNLTARSNTIILGANDTIIKRPENTTSPFITFVNQTNFAIISISFDGQNASGAPGILILGGKQFQISNNTFKDIQANAFRVYGESTDFTVENNMFTNTNVAPILLFGSPGTRPIRRFLICNNTLLNSPDNGKIGAAFASDGAITNNRIVSCEYGIGTRGVSNISVRDNWIENCSDYGIYLGTQLGDPGSSDIEIADNYILRSNIGIARYYGSKPISNVTLKDNSILYNEQWDIYADFPATFINNTITSASKLEILDTGVKFIGNTDIDGQPVIPGDISSDGKIDMLDIAIVARLFGSSSSSSNWDPSADIIADGVINMEDIAFVAAEFGFQIE